MKQFINLTALSLLVMLSGHSGVFAHGSSVSFEETKAGYFIDIGYNQEFPEALNPLRFDFVTYPEDRENVDGEVFTDVWVRIMQDKELFFSGGINKPVFGATGFTYTFPREGSYEVLARFQNEGETVVETAFTLDVLPKVEEPEMPWASWLASGGVGLVGGLIVGVVVMLFIRPKKNIEVV